MLDSPNRLENELFRHYWDDGLLDLICGIALLGIGTGWWFDQAALAAVAPALALPMWAPLRRRLIEPRAGFVEFSHARQQHTSRSLRLTLLLGIGSALLGVAAFVYVQDQGMNSEYIRFIPAVPAALLAGGAFIGAQFTRAPRFMVYGAVMLAAAGMTAVYDLGPAVPMLIGGAVVAASGAILLIRFLRASARFDA